jgi:hypothetical protein
MLNAWIGHYIFREDTEKGEDYDNYERRTIDSKSNRPCNKIKKNTTRHTYPSYKEDNRLQIIRINGKTR